MAFQATSSPTSWLFMRGVSRPMIPSLKLKRNVRFDSTSNSSSISAAASSQGALNIITHRQDDVIRPLGNFDVIRPLGNFSPDIWGDRFMTLPFTNAELESCSKKVEDLKKVVMDMLMSSKNNPIENILFINSLCRLGVSYHFETEIENQLSNQFITLPQLMDNKDHDLHIVSVIFQVFRSHGYKMPCDVFNKFKKDDNMFKEELSSNIKGIISLYEASQWATHGEHILDEALVFTTMKLKSMVVKQSFPDHLKEYIENALSLPYHKGTPRLEARQYISYYRKEESKNDVLLKFAIYDFNQVQMLHQQELRILSNWWKELAPRFPLIRHRLVENFLVSVGGLFEPRFALARNTTTKWSMTNLLIDDTYDAYVLPEELQHLTKAMQIFNRRAIDDLPGDYLKSIYESILDIVDDIEEGVNKGKKSFSVFSHVKTEIRRVLESNHTEAVWAHQHTLPPLDEYIESRQFSIAAQIVMVMLVTGMEEAYEDVWQWMTNYDDKFLRAVCLLCRLYNDIQSSEDEEKRGLVLSWTACYMKEYGVSKEEAIEACRELMRSTWKDMNEGLFMARPTPIPRNILMISFDLARISAVLYKDDEGFTKPGISLKHTIAKVLIDAIPLDDQ